jgi:hypothetical protein
VEWRYSSIHYPRDSSSGQFLQPHWQQAIAFTACMSYNGMVQICKHVSLLTVRSAVGNKLHFILRYVWYSTITGHINLGTGVDGSGKSGWEIIKYRGWKSFRNNTETKDLGYTILRTQEKCTPISRCIVQTGTISKCRPSHHNSTRGDTTTATGHKTHIYNTTLRDLSNQR